VEVIIKRRWGAGAGLPGKRFLKKLTCDIVFVLAEILGLGLRPKTTMLMAYNLPDDLQQEK
jgi:hypothetical protein